MLIPTIRSIWDFKGEKKITCIMGFCSSNHECKKNPRQHPTVLVLTLPGAFLGGCLPASGQMSEDDFRPFGAPRSMWYSERCSAPTTLRRIFHFQLVNGKETCRYCLFPLFEPQE